MLNVDRCLMEGLQNLSKHTGLHYDPPTFSLSGEYRRRSLCLTVFGTKPRYVRIRLSLPTVSPLSLALTNQSLFNGLEQRLGLAIRTGDPAFDHSYVIKSHPRALAKQLVASPTLRKRLLQCRGLSIRLQSHNLQLVSWASWLVNPPYMLHLLNLLDLIAKGVERYERPSE